MLRFLFDTFLSNSKPDILGTIDKEKSLVCLATAKARLLDHIGEELKTEADLKRILDSGEYLADQMKRAGITCYPLTDKYSLVLNNNRLSIKGESNHEKSTHEPQRTPHR